MFISFIVTNFHIRKIWVRAIRIRTSEWTSAILKRSNIMKLVICLYVCLSVRLSVCLPACLLVCLPACLSVCLSVHLSVCLPVCLSICLCVCSSVCLSVCPSVCLSVCVSVRLCVCPSVRPSICLSVCPFDLLIVWLFFTDMDECRKDPCPKYSKCRNEVGSYRCACVKGYVLRGKKCEDVDECKTTKPCTDHARCTNTAGGYSCNCIKGTSFILGWIQVDVW